MAIPGQKRHYGVHWFPSAHFPWWLHVHGCTDGMKQLSGAQMRNALVTEAEQ